MPSISVRSIPVIRRRSHRATLQLSEPQQKAVAVWTLQKDVQQRGTELQQNRDMSGAERQQAAVALAAEANGKLTEILSPPASPPTTIPRRYWLRQLDNAAKPRTPPSQRPAGGG